MTRRVKSKKTKKNSTMFTNDQIKVIGQFSNARERIALSAKRHFLFGTAALRSVTGDLQCLHIQREARIQTDDRSVGGNSGRPTENFGALDKIFGAFISFQPTESGVRLLQVVSQTFSEIWYFRVVFLCHSHDKALRGCHRGKLLSEK